MPEQSDAMIKAGTTEAQKVLPILVMERMPFVIQVIFFGALLSALKSTASATLLAPSVTFVENIWRQFFPRQNDAQELLTMRIAVLVFSACVCVYAISSQGTSIYDMVSGAYQVTLVGAFVPLVFGLYWTRATTQGALLSIVLGIGTWLLFMHPSLAELFPGQLAGFLAAFAGMLAGSLLPQFLANRHGPHHKVAGVAAS
jgi:Na+/proline symporter